MSVDWTGGLELPQDGQEPFVSEPVPGASSVGSNKALHRLSPVRKPEFLGSQHSRFAKNSSALEQRNVQCEQEGAKAKNAMPVLWLRRPTVFKRPRGGSEQNTPQ